MKKNGFDSKIKQNFREDGFIILREFVSKEQIEKIQREFDRYVEKITPKVKRGDVFYEELGNAGTLKQLHNMFEYDEFFFQLVNNKRFIELAEFLLDDPVQVFDLEWFNKPPKIGLESPPHQDNYYFQLQPPKALTMWLAMDLVNEENGCVRYIPGSNLLPLREHYHRTDRVGFSQGIVDYGEEDSKNEVPAYVKPGDVIIHDCRTIHRANSNQSDKNRRAFGFIYRSQNAKQNKELLEKIRENVLEDWEKLGKM